MLWNTLREFLRESLPESEFDLWINPLVYQNNNRNVLELAGPDRFFCAWVQQHYLELIRTKLNELKMGGYQVKFSVQGKEVLQIQNQRANQLQLPGVALGSSSFRSLHPRYTFDHFMVGESNLLARSACDAIAKGDATYGNCLFINSSTGLGKSHLTQAVAHTVIQGSPSARLHYLTAQQFSAEMVKGIRANAMDQFSRKFVNNCDILLMEDVHTLTGKNKTQEELNNILDYLLKSGKRVVFTSAVAPCGLEGIDEDFKSRMTAGLVAQIKAPDFETRANIVRHKAQMNNLCLNDEIVEFIARHLHGDVRRIESAVLGIKAKSSLLNMPPDETLVKDVIAGLLGRLTDITGENIQKFISDQFKVSVKELQSKSRKRHIAYPRQIGMYLSRKYTDMSLNDIGHFYNRDHSTVLYAIKSITKDMACRTAVREQVEFLCRKLKK